MKTLSITLITGFVLSQALVSVATSSENSAAQDVAAAKSLAFGGVGVAGLMSEGERNLRAVLERPMPRSNCKLRFLTPHRHASFTFWLACAGVIALRTEKSLIRWVARTMTLKSCVDV